MGYRNQRRRDRPRRPTVDAPIDPLAMELNYQSIGTHHTASKDEDKDEGTYKRFTHVRIDKLMRDVEHLQFQTDALLTRFKKASMPWQRSRSCRKSSSRRSLVRMMARSFLD